MRQCDQTRRRLSLRPATTCPRLKPSSLATLPTRSSARVERLSRSRGTPIPAAGDSHQNRARRACPVLAQRRPLASPHLAQRVHASARRHPPALHPYRRDRRPRAANRAGDARQSPRHRGRGTPASKCGLLPARLDQANPVPRADEHKRISPGRRMPGVEAPGRSIKRECVCGDGIRREGERIVHRDEQDDGPAWASR